MRANWHYSIIHKIKNHTNIPSVLPVLQINSATGTKLFTKLCGHILMVEKLI